MADSIRPSSMLPTIDLTDPKSIRRVMIAIQYYLTHVIISDNVPALKDLSEQERRSVQTIRTSIRVLHSSYCVCEETSLLLEAALRFIYAETQDDKAVLAAAEVFSSLADRKTLAFPKAFPAEYQEACNKMKKIRGQDIFRIKDRLQELAPGAFGFQEVNTLKANRNEQYCQRKGIEVRDMTAHEQFAPASLSKGPVKNNLRSCERCIHKKVFCDGEVRGCSACRMDWAGCRYQTQELTPVPRQDVATTISSNSSKDQHKTSTTSAVAACTSVANSTVANLTVADVPVETTVSKKAKASSPLQKFPTLTTSTSTNTQNGISITNKRATEDYNPDVPPTKRPAFQKPSSANTPVTTEAPVAGTTPDSTKAPVTTKISASSTQQDSSAAKKRPLVDAENNAPPAKRITRFSQRSIPQDALGLQSDLTKDEPLAKVSLRSADPSLQQEPETDHPSEVQSDTHSDSDSEYDSDPDFGAGAMKNRKIKKRQNRASKRQPYSNLQRNPENDPNPDQRRKQGGKAKKPASTNVKANTTPRAQLVRDTHPNTDQNGEREFDYKRCNTCQSNRSLSEYDYKAPKKNAPPGTPRVLNGYCLRCKRNKLAKNAKKIEDVKAKETSDEKGKAQEYIIVATPDEIAKHEEDSEPTQAGDQAYVEGMSNFGGTKNQVNDSENPKSAGESQVNGHEDTQYVNAKDPQAAQTEDSANIERDSKSTATKDQVNDTKDSNPTVAKNKVNGRGFLTPTVVENQTNDSGDPNSAGAENQDKEGDDTQSVNEEFIDAEEEVIDENTDEHDEDSQSSVTKKKRYLMSGGLGKFDIRQDPEISDDLIYNNQDELPAMQQVIAESLGLAQGVGNKKNLC